MRSLRPACESSRKYPPTPAEYNPETRPPVGGERRAGRTHTFGVKRPAEKLRGKAVYQLRDIVIRDGKPVPRNGDEGS
jgi:hypothetical protein